MKILIAEDDLASRMILQRFLEDYGDVDVTVNGEEAVDVFMRALDENQPYDIICLDILMPEMNGMKVLEKIRNKEKSMGISSDKKVKLIVTTSLDAPRSFPDNEDTAVKGTENYLTKPIDLQKLSVILEKYGFSKE
ncbi:response regulator [Candidatus Magnetomonas plexicatena]|uniref:response regulator n=1 Tax=Candidatus Magnetomonas plexicatena TaxID=2552947 RepID=UPI001100A06A|nr:response regulator [Nitrospirales bacterium LBB_01]